LLSFFQEPRGPPLPGWPMTPQLPNTVRTWFPLCTAIRRNSLPLWPKAIDEKMTTRMQSVFFRRTIVALT